MFLENKYTNWYFKIIENAKNKTVSGYGEKHHIIPKCLGGSNDDYNKVKLTAREHFIVHRLLVKMTVGKDKTKMSFALYCMLRKNKNHIGRHSLIISSREYETVKKLVAEAISNVHKNKIVSKETTNKMLESRKRNNKTYPESARILHSKNSKKRWEENRDRYTMASKSPEKSRKISLALKGKDSLPLDKRIRLSENNKGSGNERARKIEVISPEGRIYVCYGNFQNFCKEHNLPFSTMCHILHKTRSFDKGATVG